MIWSHPFAFIGLIAVPLVFFFIARYTQKRYASILNAFSKEMRAKLFAPRSKTASAIKGGCLLASCLAFTLFLAGPKSASLEETESPALGRDIFVILDVSESMNAEEVAPNRLAMAKLHIEDLLETTHGDRIGLIAFAGAAQVEVPLTTDYGIYRTVLRKLDTTTIRTAGTAIGDAIRLALERFGTTDNDRSRAIILITDGEDHESLPFEAARNAADAKVPVFAIAIGDVNGAKIPVVDASGHKSFKTYDGEIVLSKPDVAGLKEIAKISHGKYFYAGANLDLANVYKTSVDTLKRSEYDNHSQIQYKDLYQPFLAFGAIFFALYYFFPTNLPITNARTLTLLLSLALFCSSPVHAEDNNNATESQASNGHTLSSRQALKEYNRAMKLFSEDRITEADAIQSSLVDSLNKEVSGRVNYNLAVGSLNRALELAKQLETLPQEENKDAEKADESSNAKPPKPEELIAKYNAERQQRQELQEELEQEIQNSRRHFGRGTQSKKLGQAAQKNADTSANWLLQRREQAQEQETAHRIKALPSVELQLLWFQEETQNSIDELEHIEREALSGSAYQRMFKMNKFFQQTGLEADEFVALCAEQLRGGNTASGNMPTNASSQASQQIQIDPEGAVIIDNARKEYLEANQTVNDSLTRYDANKSRKALHNALTKLDLTFDVLTSYPDLAIRLDAEEQKAVANNTKERLSKIDTLGLEPMYWNRVALANSVYELERKAEEIVQHKDTILASRDAAPTQEQEVELSDVFDDETNDAPETNETDTSDDSPENAPSAPQQKSPEEKLLESSEIALKYRSQLPELIDRHRSLLGNDAEQPERLTEKELDDFIETQNKLSRIFQEIVRPLQDEQNQQDQNQDSDNNDNDNKDQQKQDKNQEQNQQDQGKQDPQQQDTKQDQEEQQNQQDRQDSSNDRQEEQKKDDAKQDESKAEKPKPTQEEQEAEALIRQVERRQKDAEEQRRLIRQLSTKREKFGKDW